MPYMCVYISEWQTGVLANFSKKLSVYNPKKADLIMSKNIMFELVGPDYT